MAFNFGSFDYDKNDGYGGFSVDDSGSFNVPGLSGSGALSPGGMNQYLDVSYARQNSGDSLSKVFEALEKANLFKSQSSGTGTGSSTSTGNGGTFQKISDTASVYFPPPRQKITGGSSGGGLGSAIGGIAGTALSLIPGVGQVGAALLPKVGSTVGGLFG
jgi:hypothetical protein